MLDSFHLLRPYPSISFFFSLASVLVAQWTQEWVHVHAHSAQSRRDQFCSSVLGMSFILTRLAECHTRTVIEARAMDAAIN